MSQPPDYRVPEDLSDDDLDVMGREPVNPEEAWHRLRARWLHGALGSATLTPQQAHAYRLALDVELAAARDAVPLTGPHSRARAAGRGDLG